MRLDGEKNATQRFCIAAAAKQGQGQYDKAKKPAQKGGDRNAGVAVKEGKASWKGGGTGGKNPKSYDKTSNTKSYESSNSGSYGRSRSASTLHSKDDNEGNGDGSQRNPRSFTNTSNTSRNSQSHTTSASSRGDKSLQVFSDEDEDNEDDGSRRSSSASIGIRKSRLSNSASGRGKGRSRLHVLSDEEENTDEDVFDEGEVASTDDDDTYAELPIMPIPPAGFVLAEDGSVSIMAPPQKRITTLMDQETKSPLDCLIRRVFSSADGRQCFLLCPLDTPVQILRVDDGEVLKELSDEELEDVFPTASYELAKRRLHLVQSGYCLTLRGGFCYSDDDVIDLDTVYGESEGDRSLNEGVEVASFLWNDSEYLIFTPVDPLMFVSYKDNKTGELFIADDDLLEDEAVLDAIDEEKEFQAYMEEDNLVFEDEEEQEEE